MEEFFIELFEYNHHYNQELIAQFIVQGDKVPEKSLKLLSHVINAQRIWNSRIYGNPAAGVWDITPNELLREMDNENFTSSQDILRSRNPDDIVDYINSKGDSYSNKIKDILFHVVNHGTYHRGQIAANCKEHEIEPLVTDFIFYKR